MKVKCLMLFILMIFCIVTTSGCSYFEEKNGEGSKSSVTEEKKSSGDSEELSGYEQYPSSEAPVFEEVEFDKNSLRFSEIFNDFDTVTASPEAFKKAASNGTVELYLRGQVFEIEFDDVEISIPKTIMENEKGFYTIEGAPISTYKGKVAGVDDSLALITVGEDVILGNIDTGNMTSYYIEQTNQTLNGKVIHVIYSSADYKPRQFTEYNEL